MSLRDKARSALGGDGLDPAVVDEAIFGTGSLDKLNTGRIVAKPIDIMDIWADVQQPRRAVPPTIGLHRTGSPDEVADLLTAWHTAAQMASQTTIDVEALLRGEGEGVDADNKPSVYLDYIELVRLAAGIARDGLLNPITVVESDGHYLIETGERRWLAHHLLRLHQGDQWARVPAQVANGEGFVWRQASENTARRQLNAIGMARQLALLIMAARDKIGQGYRDYAEVVGAMNCDRRFYAQVADGNTHRIPSGMAERIQAAMNLSEKRVADYRTLLRLTDDDLINDVLWVRADAENWPERGLRDVRTLPAGKVAEVVRRDTWTIEDLRPAPTLPTGNVAEPARVTGPNMPPGGPVPQEWMNQWVQTDTGLTGKVVGVSGNWITYREKNTGQQRSADYRKLVIIPEPTLTPRSLESLAASPSERGEDLPTVAVGDTVLTRTGSTGTVKYVNGRMILVEDANGQKAHDLGTLRQVERAPQVERAEAAPLPEAKQGQRVWLTDRDDFGVFKGYERGADGLTWARVEYKGKYELVSPLSIETDGVLPEPAATPALGHVTGTDEMVSDKSPSAVRLFPQLSQEYNLLHTLSVLAGRMDAHDAKKALEFLRDATDVQAQEIEHPDEQMNEFYVTFGQFFERVLVDYINPILTKVVETAQVNE